MEDDAAGTEGIPSGMNVSPEVIKKQLEKKLNRDELELSLKDKTDKAEMDMAKRLISVLHKQIAYVSLLLT